jgi:general secretion pathway protein K
VSGESKVKPEKQKKTLWRDQQGMALLITVMTVSLLVAVTLQYHKTTWQQFLVANHYKVGNQLAAIADSGVNIALTLLEHEGAEQQNDSLLDSWAVVDKETFEGLFPTGSLQLKVVDLSGRLQINSLVPQNDDDPGGDAGEESEEPPGEESDAGGDSTENGVRSIFLRLLLSGVLPIEDETEARSIVDALVDWIDRDDRESDIGAESSYYQSLSKPYGCRNGPVRSLEELLLIRGITPALLFGTGEKPGLADYLTVNGNDGRVNINTAPLLVIKSLEPLITDDLLVKLDEYRREKDNEESLANSGWYKQISGWPGDIVINESLLSVTSRYFQIIATGRFDTLSRSVVAIAERSSEGEGEGQIKLLGKKME